jgi:ABC-type nickel/cobalt efflux system permease component RcnA
MNSTLRRSISLALLFCCTAVLVWLTAAAPSQAHWADMAAAEVIVHQSDVQITLTFPTGLTVFADDDRNGQLSAAEIQAHAEPLQDFFNQKVRLTDSKNQSGRLTIQPIEGGLPPTLQLAPDTHSTLRLNYAWAESVQGLQMHYTLFLPGVATASCLTTILQSGQLKTFVFTPNRQTLALVPGLNDWMTGSVWLAIVGAFCWGAIHSMSPGHGKTIVGAYLVGERATPKHALLLALTATVTHTIGVFALGFATLFAAQSVLPAQLYPWLSLISGILVIAIGLNLLVSRLRRNRHAHHHHHHPDHSVHTHDPEIAHVHAHHTHNHTHNHHLHEHDRSHFYLPPGADGSPVTWRSLIGLGISGGLVPCPAALVLLLSTIALGQVALGLVLVLAFSLGLAGVLTGLGLLLVYAKQLFKWMPSQIRVVKIVPAISAVCIALVGFGISTRALFQLLHQV